MLRGEGIYSSYLAMWRKEREHKQRKRGRKGSSEVENEGLRLQLEQAQTIIDVQKKLSQLLNLPTNESQESES